MMPRPFSRFLSVSIAIAIALAGCKPKDQTPASTTAPSKVADTELVVMTAASAKDAMTDIASDFQKETGIRVTVAAGGSNMLAAQIIAGAPASLFLSADVGWANQVQEKGLVSRMQPLLSNELVLIVPKGNPGHVKAPADLLAGSVRKVALAGPNVPAGRYAEQALRSLQLYSALLDKIVRGQDVRVAENFVERGEAEAGIVYSTDAIHSNLVEAVYQFDQATYDKIVYPLMLLKPAEKDDAGRRFFDYLLSANPEKVFARYGFVRLKQ